MASRVQFRNRKPNPRLQQISASPFSNKKIIIITSMVMIGSAVIYFLYSKNKMKSKIVNDDNNKKQQNIKNEAPHLMSASFSSQSKYEKKISKFEAKRENLISKNPRLRNKNDIKKHIIEHKKRFKLNKLKYSYFEKEENEYNELILLLTDKEIVLKPQMIHHYVALLIKLFMGANMCSVLNRNAKIIDKYNQIIINQQFNDNDDNLDGNKYRLTRIQSIFPMIKDKKWDSKINTLSFNTNFRKKEIVGNNNFGFGVLSDRFANRIIKNDDNNKLLNISDYEIYPYFLNNYNQWTVFQDDIYFSTIYKDYIYQNDFYNRRDIVDNSYRLTQNIVDAVIIINNKYGHIALFATKSGIFMTDPRIKYKDIKKPWKEDEKDNNNDDEKKEDIQIRRRTYSMLSSSSKYEDTINTKVSNAILCEINTYWGTEGKISKLFTSNNNNIYALCGDGCLFELYWDDDNIDIDKKQYLKLINSIDNKQPNYKLKRGREHNEYLIYGKYVTAKLEDDDPMKTQITRFKDTKFEEKCNEEIRKHNLIKIRKYKQFQLGGRRKLEDFLIYGIYLDEDTEILYLCQQKRSDISGWTLKFLYEENKNQLIDGYKSVYKKFMDSNKYLQRETCYIMFVDDRDIHNKQVIIILNQYVVTIPLLITNNNNKENKNNFGKIYDINKVQPYLKNKGIGCKWFYSASKQSLYLFEKISNSAEHSYQLKRISLDSFRFL